MQDEELYLLFKEALNNTLSTLKSLLETRQHITLWPVEEPEFLPDGSIKIRMVLKLRVLSLPNVQQRLSNVSQVSKLCKFVSGSHFSKQLVAQQAATPASEQIFLQLFWPFLQHYLSKVDVLDFDQNIFQDIYEDIATYFISPTIKLVFAAPLLGFDSESNEETVDLAPNVSINRISSELKKQLWHDTSISSSWSKEDVVSLKYQATFTEDVPKTDLFSYSTYPEDLENLQSLLRLIKREPISIMCVLLTSSPWYLGSYAGMMPRYLLWSTAKPLIGRYLLPGSFQGCIMAPSFSPEEIESLKSSWNSLVTMRNQPRLILAFRRFSFSYDRSTPEDRFLDLWIGLELLFPDPLEAKKGATNRKLGIIPTFLGLTNRNRKQMSKTLNDSKELRREIVHGLPYQYKPSEFVPKVESILAESLVKCLTQQSLPQP